MSLAREYNQKNLVPVSKIQMLKLEEKINQNYFLGITKNSNLSADSAVRVCKKEDRILFVSHFIPKPEGGLQLVYKIDCEILSLYNQKFGNF
jgi:hypothetical protein